MERDHKPASSTPEAATSASAPVHQPDTASGGGASATIYRSVAPGAGAGGGAWEADAGRKGGPLREGESTAAKAANIHRINF